MQNTNPRAGSKSHTASVGVNGFVSENSSREMNAAVELGIQRLRKTICEFSSSGRSKARPYKIYYVNFADLLLNGGKEASK